MILVGNFLMIMIIVNNLLLFDLVVGITISSNLFPLMGWSSQNFDVRFSLCYVWFMGNIKKEKIC